jgi:hypothetical protein
VTHFEEKPQIVEGGLTRGLYFVLEPRQCQLHRGDEKTIYSSGPAGADAARNKLVAYRQDASGNA